MKFDKKNFVAKEGYLVYGMLIDFLDCEVNNKTYDDLKILLSLENIRSFVYEGNKYIIKKSIDDNMVLIIDEVAEDQGVCLEKSRFEIDSKELLDILSETKEILEEKI